MQQQEQKQDNVEMRIADNIMIIIRMMRMMMNMMKADPSEDFLRDKVDAAVLRP